MKCYFTVKFFPLSQGCRQTHIQKPNLVNIDNLAIFHMHIKNVQYFKNLERMFCVCVVLGIKFRVFPMLCEYSMIEPVFILRQVLSCPDWPCSNSVAQAALEPVILLPQSHKWDNRSEPPSLANKLFFFLHKLFLMNLLVSVMVIDICNPSTKESGRLLHS